MDRTSDLVDRWVEGWSESRGASHQRVGRGWSVDLAEVSRSREYVIAAPQPEELRRFVELTTGPHVWLTVVGELGPETADALSLLDAVTHAETMMTSAVAHTAMPNAVHLELDGRVAHAHIELDGEIAARGQAAVHGTDVVFDRIKTTPRFRRRGLGRQVMAGLTSWAADRDASTGLLMASAEGRQLYVGLGWHDVSEIATFRGRAS